MDKTVIITLIICATLIAIVAIISDHITDYSNNRVSNKIVKVHRNYIAGILGFAVIMLITAQYGNSNNEIFAYLSFGSTITSLVLSILAIFVTVQSSSDLYKQFTRIDNVANSIQNVSNQINSSLEMMKQTESDLQQTSNGISKQLSNIIDQIDEKLRERIKETEGNITKQLEASINRSYGADVQQMTSIYNSQFKDNFKELTSGNGLLALYSLALSKEKESKMFELSSLFKGNENYIFGYMICALSSGIVSFTADESLNQITCTDSIYSSEELYDKIKEAAKQFGQEYIEQTNEINRFFGVQDLIQFSARP